jgi:hypothetical protein
VAWANQSTRGDKHRPTNQPVGLKDSLSGNVRVGKHSHLFSFLPHSLQQPPKRVSFEGVRPQPNHAATTQYVRSSLSFFFVLLKNVSYLLSSVRCSFIVRNLKGYRQITSFWADEMD